MLIPFHFCNVKLHSLSLIGTLPVTIFMSSELYCLLLHTKGVTAPSTIAITNGGTSALSLWATKAHFQRRYVCSEPLSNQSPFPAAVRPLWATTATRNGGTSALRLWATKAAPSDGTSAPRALDMYWQSPAAACPLWVRNIAPKGGTSAHSKCGAPSIRRPLGTSALHVSHPEVQLGSNTWVLSSWRVWLSG